MRERHAEIPVGRAAIAWYEAAAPARAIVALGHGSATGIDAPDLQAIATVLPALGITVALVTQPYRVIALSYPLLGPGSPRELLSTGLPLLVVQGGLDPYGTPDRFPPLPPTTTLVEVPFANHTFGVSVRAGNTTTGALATVTAAVTTWLDGLLASP